ncbi:recombinase RecT [Lactococcus lactis subsp. hordniae]
MANQTPTQVVLKSDAAKRKFEEVLGKKTNGFVGSLLSLVGSTNLKNVDSNSVMTAAMKAATLDLPIEPSLGFAYVIPYGREAQFQIGYKGLIQLAIRSGQVTKLNAGPVYENQFIKYDNLFEELEIDFTIPKGTEIAGYFASMELINGFRKVIYWDKEQVLAHGKRFSKSFSRSSSPWQTDFDAMATKTVLKAMLSTYAPLSTEMQQAIVADNESATHKDVTPDVTDDLVLEAVEETKTDVIEEQGAPEAPQEATKPETYEELPCFKTYEQTAVLKNPTQ